VVLFRSSVSLSSALLSFESFLINLTCLFRPQDDFYKSGVLLKRCFSLSID